MQRAATPVDGLTLSRLALGTMRLPEATVDVARLLERAVSLGLTTVDLADIYGGGGPPAAGGGGVGALGGDREAGGAGL